MPRHLVYNQSCEDPRVDVAALAPHPGDTVLTIASGGCNALHLAGTGAHVVAIDDNAEQVALTELKVAARRHFSPRDFRAVFTSGRDEDQLLRDLPVSNGTNRIHTQRNWFAGAGLYSRGALGHAGRLLRTWARAAGCRRDLEEAFAAPTLEEQVAAWERARRCLWTASPGAILLSTPLPLMAFGVPAKVCTQMRRPSRQVADGVDRVMRSIPAHRNWFWQRLLLDDYTSALPPYLVDVGGPLRGSVDVRLARLQETLARTESSSLDGVALLDTPHWLRSGERAAMWAELARVVRPGGRVSARLLGPVEAPPAGSFRRVPIEVEDLTGCYLGAIAFERRA